MELSSIKHVDPSQLGDFEDELFITCLGYESRGTTVARAFQNNSCRKIVLENSSILKEFS